MNLNRILFMIMDQHYKSFVVIKVLTQNKPDLDKYVCVPSLWIKVKDHHNDNVVFGYPSESRSATERRVIEYELAKTRWPSLYGKVVYDTDFQEDAFNVMQSKNSRHEHETEDQANKSKPENEETKTASEKEKTSSKKIKRKQTESDDMSENNFQAKSKKIGNELDKKFELQISKLFEMIRAREVSPESNDDRSESPVSSSSSETSETCESPNDMENNETETNVKNTKTPITERRCARRSKALKGYFRIDNECSSDNYDTSDTEFVGYSSSKAGKSTDKFSKNVQSDNSVPTEINENDDADNSCPNATLMSDEVYSQCNSFCTEFNESYRRTMSILDNAANYFQQVISEHRKIAKVSKKKSKDSDKRCKKISESEPPLLDTSRYNTEDSRWTLRHPEPGPGLVELMPHSGVYVTEEVLIHSQNTCRDATMFARALLEDIFKKEALEVCSLAGKFVTPKLGKEYKTPNRPGLDANARQTLIRYAKEYGTEKNMGFADVASITKSITNKLQKYRNRRST